MFPVPQPNWDELLGDASEAMWIADRDRKAALASDEVRELLRVRHELGQRGALCTSSPVILQDVLCAADWYVSLAGYSLKTLRQLEQIPAAYGLKRRPAGVLEALRMGRAVDPTALAAFSRWMNAEIAQLYPVPPSDDVALLRVALIRGGRIIGVGQNSGGDEAVLLVKRLMIGHLHPLGCEVSAGAGFEAYDATVDLLTRTRFRFAGELVCEFIPGGDRPDLKVIHKSRVVAIGEIKGRKDVSNLWESWMPQVADHMRTWKGEYPDAARLFLGTVMTKEMVDGISVRGTQRTGLKQLYEEGSLNGAINISAVVERKEPSLTDFASLMEALSRHVTRPRSSIKSTRSSS